MRFEATEYLSLHSPALKHCDFVPGDKALTQPPVGFQTLAAVCCLCPGPCSVWLPWGSLAVGEGECCPTSLPGTCNPLLPLPGLQPSCTTAALPRFMV